jgi:ATP-dependent helicase YprA (DUF1998 family)
VPNAGHTKRDRRRTERRLKRGEVDGVVTTPALSIYWGR